MAPSFDHLREADLDDDEFDEDEIDISDLREKYEVQLEQGYDAFVVIDGLPEVTEDQKPKLVKFLMKKLNGVGRVREESVYMPMGDDGKSLRFVLSARHAKRCIGTQLTCADLPLLNTRPRAKPQPQSVSSTWLLSTRNTRCESTR